MDVEKIEERQEKKNALKSKIKNDRVDYRQEIGWAFRPLALCPFPSRGLGKRTIIDKHGNQKEEYEIIWKRRSKNVFVEIVAHPDYGIPYGQDILVVLYLAIKAREQNSRRIKVDFYRDLMNLWGMNPNDGRKYKLIVDSLNRIRNSKYSWEVIGDNRQIALHYMYIDEMDLICSPKDPDQKPLFEQYIILSERFWDEINRHKIPFNLDAIRFLKAKSAHLNFYLWLSVRTGQLFFEMIEKKTKSASAFIPYFGDDGLQNQLSSVIEKRHEFRREVAKWLKQAKELWPLCPARIEGDGIKIELTNMKQLDVQPDINKLSGKIMRLEQEKSTEGTGKQCPGCNRPLELKTGITLTSGQKLDDFYNCSKCRKNFYRKQYPDLYK